MLHQTLLTKYSIISDQIDRQAMTVVLRELEKTLEQGMAGDIAEFGCYIGTTSIFIRRLMDGLKQSSSRKFYAYDSFEGLPDKTTADGSSAGVEFKAGVLSISKKQFLKTFQKTGLTTPITIKAWFKDLTAEQLPDKLAYVFLDGDFYQSIIDSLKLVWPRLTQGGTITVDDYNRAALPGVTLAVSEFFQGKNIIFHHEHGIAIIKKN
jgi:O-methyltransferase